jgi:hypothetical protein
MTEATDRQQMQLFRGAKARSLMEAGVMHVHPFTSSQRAGMDKLIEAGYLEGDETKVLISIPGFSLVHAWFKKDYPLLRHSHDADCLYYVVAGSLRLGTETLGVGDGFFHSSRRAVYLPTGSGGSGSAGVPSRGAVRPPQSLA